MRISDWSSDVCSSDLADVTAGSADLISQVISRVGNPHDSVDDLQPRLDRAMQWTAEFVPVEDRTTVRTAPDTARLAALSEQEAEWIRLLLDNLHGYLELDEVTAVVYGGAKRGRDAAIEGVTTAEGRADPTEYCQ